MQYFKIDKETLLNLLLRSNFLRALERGGVDNWEFYGIALSEYLIENEIESFEELGNELLENFDKI